MTLRQENMISNKSAKVIHPGFTCSKLTIETLEQNVKYVQI